MTNAKQVEWWIENSSRLILTIKLSIVISQNANIWEEIHSHNGGQKELYSCSGYTFEHLGIL